MRKCRICGTDLSENDVFCTHCGTKVEENEKIGGNNNQQQMNYQPANQEQMNYQPANQEQMNYQPAKQEQMNYQPANQEQMNYQPANQGQMNYQPANQGQMNYQTNNQMPNKQLNGQRTNSQPSGNTNRNSNSVVKTCIISIIVVAIIVGAGFGIYYLVKGNDKTSSWNEYDSWSNNSTFDNDFYNQKQSDSATSNGGRSTTSSNVVTFEGFEFNITNDYDWEITSIGGTPALAIANDSYTWTGYTTIIKGSFKQIKNKKNEFKKYIESEVAGTGATVGEPTIETINGNEVLLMMLSEQSENCYYAITEIDSNYIAMVVFTSKGGNYKNDVKEMLPIIKNAKYKGESSTTNTSTKSSNNKKINAESIKANDIKIDKVIEAFNKTLE